MMGHHVPGDESPFLKRFFIPFYFIRIFLYLLHIIIYGILLAGLIWVETGKETAQALREKEKLGNTAIGVAIACVAVSFVFAVGCLSVDISCIVKRHRRTLTPKYFLIANIIQTLFWGGSIILSIIVVHNVWNILVDVIVLISFMGLLIHASVVYHRSRKGGIYARAHNPSSKLEQQSLADGYEPYTSVGQSYSQPEGPHHSAIPPSYPNYPAYPQPQQHPVYNEKSRDAESHAGSVELGSHVAAVSLQSTTAHTVV